MKEKCCIYCDGEQDNPPLAVCKSCSKLWNENWEKFMPINEEYDQLLKDSEGHIKQAMTGHTCGVEAGGDPYWFCSSDCIGCFPDTTQHYRAAASIVIAWTMGWIEKNIMKNVLLPHKVGHEKGKEGE